MAAPVQPPPTAEKLLHAIGKGAAIRPPAGERLQRMFGVEVGLEGLSRLFQPGFIGVRAFVIQSRVAPDQAVEITLVGVARDGRPVWTGTRALAYGHDGSLEIHRGFDEIAPEYRSRNITVDLMRRELDILSLLGGGRAARLTIDAEGVGRYVCALHGFVFADETEEGPPVRSVRAFEPEGDRARLLAAAPEVIERVAKRSGVGRIAIEAAVEQAKKARCPWDFAALSLPGASEPLAEGNDAEFGVGRVGRELLLGKDTPAWRGALYLFARDERARELGEAYRRRKTQRSDTRVAEEIAHAREGLRSSTRATRIRALNALGMIGPGSVASDVRELEDDADRRVASVARQTARRISGAAQADHLLAFAEQPKNDGRLRGLAYRVLAEHFPGHLESRVPMLRIHPDARIQRAAVPLVLAGPNPGPALAAMLRANPWTDPERRGLLGLRVELIEHLTHLAEPATLPTLLEAFRTETRRPPAELLALSRALIAFPDPRAQVVLNEATRRLERPEIP